MVTDPSVPHGRVLRDFFVKETMIHLNDLGFDPANIEELKKKGIPGRISSESHGLFTILTEGGELKCRLRGRDLLNLVGTADYPVTGDFVLADEAGLIRQILPRQNLVTRGDHFSASLTEGLVANCSYIFVVISLNQDFHERKIRRFLIMAQSSGAQPVLILTKADLNSEEANEAFLEKAHSLTQAPIIVTRSDRPDSVRPILELLAGGRSAALIGASGVGKSTLINLILGEDVMKTSGIRQSDDQGRHTTTHREIIVIPGVGCLIDTPGMRRIYLQDDGEAVGDVFETLTRLMRQCKFANCTHHAEPGCAVQGAIRSGAIRASDLSDYQEMQREARFFESKARIREKERAKKIIHSTKKPRQKAWDKGDW